MKKIAPELDSLMWTIAEENNERAIDEFGARHPEMRAELLRRIQMVKGLRSAGKPATAVTASIPRFVPREPKHVAPPSRSAIMVVGGLSLAALAAAAFLITTLVTPEKRYHKEDLPPTRPTVTQHTEAPANPTTPVIPQSKVEVPPVDNSTSVAMGNQSEAAKPPTSVTIDHAPLLTVLQMMSDICGVRIDAAPGLANPLVDVDYHNQSPMEMLHDLGRKYAFTPLDQHDGSILVVPAVDKGGTMPIQNEPGAIRGQKIGG